MPEKHDKDAMPAESQPKPKDNLRIVLVGDITRAVSVPPEQVKGFVANLVKNGFTEEQNHGQRVRHYLPNQIKYVDEIVG